MRSLLCCLALAAPAAARADMIHHYYVGVDTRDLVPSGAYAGLKNPNDNRLTFLYGHYETTNLPGAHYHSKGNYSYTGPNNGDFPATATQPYTGTFGVSNAVRDAGVFQLLPGSGPLAGLYVSGIDPNDDSGDTTLKSVDALSGFAPGTGEHFQFNSASGRWTTSLAAANLRLTLVSIASGLTVVAADGSVLFDSPGDFLDLGKGDTFSFTPIFAAADNTLTGSAVFTLSDLNGVFGDSGQFVYNVTSVPEPSSIFFVGVLGVAAAYRRFRRSGFQA